jgi:hypothetical protein
MNSDKTQVTDTSSAGLTARTATTEDTKAIGVYSVECFDASGALKWSDTFNNLVTTVGKNFMLDTTFSGSAYTAGWFLGLVTGPGSGNTYAVGNTMASHAAWPESVAYSNATRVAAAFGAASSGSKATSAAVFNINATATIAGSFLVNDSTKSGTTGTLYSVGNFTGGDRLVASGDTLNVTYTATLT